jgi:hypothetical protein
VVAEKKSVFVSYSWDVENDTGIVSELQQFCQQRDLKLILDRDVLKHGESINTFMNDISGARHVITVFSDAYFRSKWCMYELLKTWWAGAFEQRTHPINADPKWALGDATYREGLVTFWKEEYQKAQQQWANHPADMVLDERKHLNIYRDIAQNISDILCVAHQRVTTPLAALRSQNYAQLLDVIQRLPPPFIDNIHRNLEQVFSDEPMTVFRSVLAAELNKLPVYDNTVGGIPAVDTTPKEVARHLTHILRTGGAECPAINKVLRNTVIRCLEEGKDKYEQVRPHRQIVLRKLEKILGFLVLSLVNEGDARDLSKWLRHDLSALYFELHIGTLGGVEIFIARQQQRSANLKVTGNTLSGRNLIVVDSSMLSWNDQEKINDLERMIYARVFGEEKDTSLESDEREDLKAELITLREIEDEDSNYCIAINFDTAQEAETYRDACQKFLSELKIPLVHYGVSGGQAAFDGIERNLMSALRNLIKKINQLV